MLSSKLVTKQLRIDRNVTTTSVMVLKTCRYDLEIESGYRTENLKQEVAPRSFEMITSDGVAIRRNQNSVHRLPEEETVPEQPPEEQENRESENQGPDPATTAKPTSEGQPPQTAVPQPLHTSSRVRKPREHWEPNWISQRRNPDRS